MPSRSRSSRDLNVGSGVPRQNRQALQHSVERAGGGGPKSGTKVSQDFTQHGFRMIGRQSKNFVGGQARINPPAILQLIFQGA